MACSDVERIRLQLEECCMLTSIPLSPWTGHLLVCAIADLHAGQLSLDGVVMEAQAVQGKVSREEEALTGPVLTGSAPVMHAAHCVHCEELQVGHLNDWLEVVSH
jgi:hypothetical protein